MLGQVAHYGSAPNHIMVMVMARGMQICQIEKEKLLWDNVSFLAKKKTFPFGTTEEKK